MKTVKISAKTIEAAVSEGLKQLGISREEAEIRVIEQPSSGLFGLIHKKDAVVEISAPESEKEVPAAEPAKAETAEEVIETPDRGEVQVEAAAEPEDGDVSEEETVTESDDEDETEVKDSKDKKTDREELPFVAEDQAVVAEEAKKFLEGVFKGMNLDVQMEKMVNEERILFTLYGKGLGILIGKHGQTLDALQYLTNLAAGKNFRRRYFVLLDVEGYRERRRQTLESLARRLAEKVKRTGEEVKLEPMPAGERRIIHLALQNDYAVSTDSEGEAPYRSVVIRAK